MNRNSSSWVAFEREAVLVQQRQQAHERGSFVAVEERVVECQGVKESSTRHLHRGVLVNLAEAGVLSADRGGQEISIPDARRRDRVTRASEVLLQTLVDKRDFVFR